MEQMYVHIFHVHNQSAAQLCGAVDVKCGAVDVRLFYKLIPNNPESFFNVRILTKNFHSMSWDYINLKIRALECFLQWYFDFVSPSCPMFSQIGTDNLFSLDGLEVCTDTDANVEN